MKTLFKSPLRKRIEAKRADLLKERMNAETLLKRRGIILRTSEYCALLSQRDQFQHDINLLSEMLGDCKK